MTAVVGILNKQAVALAADSAVTVSGMNNSHKIYNHANKIFTLSKRHPVGVMIYNSATFMSTPWEAIIKVYRRQLKDVSFRTVEEYQRNFIDFIRTKNFYTDEYTQKKLLREFFLSLINSIVMDSVKDNQALLRNPTPENKAEVLRLIELKIDELLDEAGNASEYCAEFIDYTFNTFTTFSSEPFSSAYDHVFKRNGFTLTSEVIDKLKSLLHFFLKSKETNTLFSGLIFVGYGEDEIYPSLIPLNISLVIENRLRYFIDDRMTAKINNMSTGAIRPFAQTDVINTILSGVDPKLDDMYRSSFSRFLSKYNQVILTALGNQSPELSAKITGLNINSLIEEYAKRNENIKQQFYIKPLMNTVSNLSKEDLAEMAESLIYLTYLKRRITNSEESVGGPVDVAIISKGDGFVWIKRKLYFKPELNQYFFDNYFN